MTMLCYQIIRAGIWPHVKWAVNLEIADGHCNLPQGSICVHMGNKGICMSRAGYREKFQNRYTYVQEFTATEKYQYFLLSLLVGCIL